MKTKLIFRLISLWPFLENFIQKPYKVMNFTDFVISIWQCLKSALDIKKEPQRLKKTMH